MHKLRNMYLKMTFFSRSNQIACNKSMALSDLSEQMKKDDGNHVCTAVIALMTNVTSRSKSDQ